LKKKVSSLLPENIYNKNLKGCQRGGALSDLWGELCGARIVWSTMTERNLGIVPFSEGV
jgi:hypothetical protein